MAIPTLSQPADTAVRDARARPLHDLRVSVTDRCNLRCLYCMPEREYTWLAKDTILRPAEISLLVDAFVAAGARKVRLTGGEPLLRPDLDVIVAAIASKPGVEDLAITTNGMLLRDRAAMLHSSGVHRVSVSLDSLRPDRFAAITQRGSLAQVRDGLEALAEVGFTGTKLDTVLIRDRNSDEACDLIRFAASINAEVRFIEYMDVGGANGWRSDLVYSRAEILADVGREFGDPVRVDRGSAAPAARYRLADGTVFGIVSSTTQPFCSTCNRSRLTADGVWLRCLYALGGTNLREPLRQGASVEELTELITGTWRRRRDQGAVDRLDAPARGALFAATALRDRPHLEMHTRGG